MKFTLRFFAVAACLASACLLSAQTVSYALLGGSYTQNFDGLAASGSTSVSSSTPVSIAGVSGFGSSSLSGWYGLNDRGSSAPTNEFRAQDGSLSGSSGRGIVSFGTTASSDRALGTLATSNQVSTFGVYLVNNTSTTLTQFNLSYTGEQWRAGDIGINDSLTFGYKVVSSLAAASIGANVSGFNSVSALNFNSAFIPTSATNNVALNGNSATNQSALSASQSFSWAPGDVLILQWYGQDLSGQDSGLAIDNLSFSAIPEPSTYALWIAFAALTVVTIRKVRTRNSGVSSLRA